METEQKVVYTCIGKRRTSRGLVLCMNTSQTPTWKDQYLCSDCANSRVGGGESEAQNVGAMQSDISEYRDQIAAGFAAGASRYYEGNFDGEE